MKELLGKVMEQGDIFKPATPEDVEKRSAARFPTTQEVIDILINTSNAVVDALKEPLDGDATQEVAERFLVELDYASGNMDQDEYLTMLSHFADKDIREAEDIFKPQPPEQIAKQEQANAERARKANMGRLVSTSIRGRMCLVCTGKIPPGDKYLRIPGGYRQSDKSVCKTCLGEIAKTVEGA